MNMQLESNGTAGLLSGETKLRTAVLRHQPFCSRKRAAWAARHSVVRPCSQRFSTREAVSISDIACGATSEEAAHKNWLSSGFKALLIGSLASLVISSPVWAVPGDGVASLVASSVPDSVSSAVSDAVRPVATTAGAFIPGLIGDSPLREGIVSGFLLILFSELGDKTFFLALLLALKENKVLVFGGTFGALAVMSVISVLLGQVVHQIDELGFGSTKIPFDDILACILLVFFGVQTILDARNSDANEDGEREEAEEEVSKFKEGATGLLLSTFALVFAAEWGDKSFLATIALAAASSPVGVTVGAVAGHGVATGIAVLGGSYLGKYLDEKVVQYLGGSLFLVFAAATAIDIVRGV